MENISTAIYHEKPQTFAQQGWICPKCGRVNAPWVGTCPCYGESVKFNWVTPSSTTPIRN